MPVNEQIPGRRTRGDGRPNAPEQLRALADPLRATVLELVLERAATVTEIAQAVDRPKSTVAYHVNLLVDVGLLRVVRTRRVRAIEERYYGRVARTLHIGVLNRPEDKQVLAAVNVRADAAAESAPAHAADELRCTLVHARIPIEEVRSFWAQSRNSRHAVAVALGSVLFIAATLNAAGPRAVGSVSPFQTRAATPVR